MTWTVVVQITNDDNRLTQQEWSQFVIKTDTMIRDDITMNILFFGGAHFASPYQGACWCLSLSDMLVIDELTKRLAKLARQFKQNSILMTSGNTEVITP